ncbi:MAG TPA: MFS transporter [Gaiellaceae bacterium]|nr:MFS transporter [Gaiellaceae bacterium]
MVAGRLRALRPRGPLWKRPDYVRLLSAATVSQLGSQVSLLALPFVAIATLHATTLEVAALGVADSVPLILVALPAGVWIDRVPRRRPVMIAGDLGRAAALASIPAAYAGGVLTIWQLFAVGFITGTLTVFFDVASMSFLPSILERELLADGNAGLQVSSQTAQVTGPGIAGALIGALGAPYAVLTDAISFVASAALISRVTHVEERVVATERRSMRADIREGLGYVLRHPILRPNLAFTFSANLFNAILFAVFLLFAVRLLGMSAREIGVVFVLANLGSLSGAFLVTRLQRWFGLGRVMLVTAFSGWSLLLIPFASGSTGVVVLAAALLVWGTGAVIYNTTSITIAQAMTPDRLMARMNASRRLVSYATVPLAMLLGGVLGTYLGLRTTVFIGAAGRSLAGLIIFGSPVRSIRTLDDVDALVAAHDSPSQ